MQSPLYSQSNSKWELVWIRYSRRMRFVAWMLVCPHNYKCSGIYSDWLAHSNDSMRVDRMRIYMYLSICATALWRFISIINISVLRDTTNPRKSSKPSTFSANSPFLLLCYRLETKTRGQGCSWNISSVSTETCYGARAGTMYTTCSMSEINIK